MSKKLNTFVTVHDEDFAAHTFGPGDKLPKWAKDKITNPNVWTTSPDEDSDSQETPENPSGTGTAATPEPPAAGSTESEDAGSLTPPPKVGAGSGADAWRDYAVKATKAAGLNVDFAEDAKRGDIIQALEDAKIATA
ncbi:hypothetical protein [Microbacterium sp. 77mftsu3.1]|uniref:hypothetical protein n=1 Tax=Microbacterium sp. 77mftsu3.1 TaxID=1761802 RepID=UPI0003726A4B|nr:hypothetical protein [Microbacterium sp. 77mftsu3.1]SDG21727.1 hypothetical protein SAMN04488590_0214 [Microbacterium sp. 77mftsu3.1]